MKTPAVLIKMVEAQLEARKATLVRTKEYREQQVSALAETNTQIARDEKEVVELELWLREAKEGE